LPSGTAISAIREKMLMMEVCRPIRLALVAKLSDTLTQFVVGRNWLSRRSRRPRRERDSRPLDREYRGTSRAATTCADWCGISRHRTAHCRMILLALLSANLDCSIVRSWSCRAARGPGFPPCSTTAGGASLNALLTRAGLPPSDISGVRAALEASHEVGLR